ncbi:MAG: flagellar basal-body rod protein FlgG [Planctomycetota bacterium]
MAITALNSAATGLRALSTRIDVVANNLANAETTAFKRQRVNFEDLMYLTKRHPGSLNAAGDIAPAGIQVGLGVKVSNTQLDLEQGTLDPTGGKLDLAIEGTGFFKVQVADGIGDGAAYTRNGDFFRNNEGEVILGLGSGYKLDPPINIPIEVPMSTVEIAEDGTVSGIVPGEVEAQTFGRIAISRFSNPQGLKLLGGSLFVATAASGEGIDGLPGEDGAGLVRQGFLEGSNVDPVKELVTLIKTQRNFELNSQSIKTADEALQTIGNLRR